MLVRTGHEFPGWNSRFASCRHKPHRKNNLPKKPFASRTSVFSAFETLEIWPKWTPFGRTTIPFNAFIPGGNYSRLG